jgi:EmrB/QacA subfamily drug resistance transporter
VDRPALTAYHPYMNAPEHASNPAGIALSTPHPRATLAAGTLGSSLAFIDGSVVNVALPALANDLHASASSLPWAINAYLLPLGALMLLAGGMGDHFGRRRLFLAGLVIFTLASILCAASPSLSLLLAARGVQGLGAALLMPNSLAILGSEFSGEARGRAIGTWAAVGALASAFGPVFGGWLIDTVGWRAIFLLNVPFAGAAGLLAWKYVTERSDASKVGPLDSAGAGLSTIGLGLAIWALTEASGSTTSSALLWIAALAGAAILGAFLWHERRLRDGALMPLAMFAVRTFAGLNLLTFFLYGSMGGLIVLLPFCLIRIEHWPAAAAGAALMPVPVVIAVGSRYMGKIASRHGARGPLAAGCGLVSLGLALLVRVGTGAISYWLDVLPPTLLIALGMGACVAPLTTGVMESVAADRVGIASGINNAVARIAGLIATAALGFVFARQESPAAFILGFRIAAVIGAASAAMAGICALLFMRSLRSRGHLPMS